MFEMGEQLKGAPLTDSEKMDMEEAYYHDYGSVFQRAINALSSVLNTKPTFILERGRALNREGHQFSRLKEAAEERESQNL
jgi:hypothetical protein